MARLRHVVTADGERVEEWDVGEAAAADRADASRPERKAERAESGKDRAASEIEAGPKDRAFFKWLLRVENRIRALEGKKEVTAAQAKAVFRTLMD